MYECYSACHAFRHKHLIGVSVYSLFILAFASLEVGRYRYFLVAGLHGATRRQDKS